MDNKKRTEVAVLLREIETAVSDLRAVSEHLDRLGNDIVCLARNNLGVVMVTAAETADCCEDTIDLLLALAEMIDKADDKRYRERIRHISDETAIKPNRKRENIK
ncbi:MAG: hypothetical protein NC452_01910 [Eubacterium sp.]|nr:hypothetical protein [Eubacterium sp.]